MQKRGSLASSLPRYRPGPPSRRPVSGAALISLLFLAFVLLIGFLAWTFIRNVNENGGETAPVITASLQNGDAVLLNQRILIRVEASSANPITAARLFVDGLPVGDDTPFFSEPRGVYIASLPWTPASLGRADLRISLIDDADAATDHLIRIDVTDDPSLVNSALRLSIVGIEPFQNVYLGRPIRLRASAQGDEPITRFAMTVNGAEAASAEALLNDQGVYSAALEWTPAALGAADIEIRAVSASGDIPARSFTVSVIELPGATAPPAGSSVQSQEQASAAVPASYARILAPAHQTEIELGADDRIELEVGARGTGPLSSAALYITPIDDLGNLGSSRQIWQRIGTLPPNGEFVDVVRDIQTHLDGYGWYQFEIVAFTTGRPALRPLRRPPLHPARRPRRRRLQAPSLPLPPNPASAAPTSASSPQPPRATAASKSPSSTPAPSTAPASPSPSSSSAPKPAPKSTATSAPTPSPSAKSSPSPSPSAIEEPAELLIVLEADYDIDDSDNTFAVTLEPPSGDIADLAILDAILDDDGRVIIAVRNAGTRAIAAYSLQITGTDAPPETIQRGRERDPLETRRHRSRPLHPLPRPARHHPARPRRRIRRTPRKQPPCPPPRRRPTPPHRRRRRPDARRRRAIRSS